jgi:hypothetical protein
MFCASLDRLLFYGALKEEFRNKLLELSPLVRGMKRTAGVIGELSGLFLKGNLDNTVKP